MSGTKLKLMCLVLPDDKLYEHAFQVDINDDDTVADLKKLIKDEHAKEHASLLDEVDSRDLVLWKCSSLLGDDDNLEQTLKTIRFNGSDDRIVRLKALQRISQLFGDEDLSKEPIHILVEVPMLGECGTGFSNSVRD
ncbi:hypothetical protein BGW80DRAFT_1382899 [Lactifluus volemus]|nr:hypothetical protein BGW80DRAFT_1382899 [Lactifluus volemus]